MKKYKVISQRDKWFSGTLDPVKLEMILNEHAADGWRVISMASASREGLLTGAGKDELIILLEKDLAPKPVTRERAESVGSDVYRL